MTEYTLLTVECGGIQSYVFGSNRLKENVGASYLVAQATEAWAFEALKNAKLTHNITDPKAKKPFAKGHIFDEGSTLDAEVIYFGGGNITILFRNKDHAKAFTERLSKKVLCEAPNLRLEVHSITWDSTNEKCPLGKAVGELRRGMKAAVSRLPANAPLLGLGVTAMCQETGLPALARRHIGDDRRYLSAEVLAKQDIAGAAKHAKQKLEDSLLEEHSGYTFPDDLDHLGRSRGESSYIAIVHADGNDMGDIIKQIGTESADCKYIDNIRAFSQATKRISLAAMKAVIDLLIEKTVEGMEILGVGTVPDLKFTLSDQNHMNLPIRPIIFGGDDTTFVCDGRIGVALAVEYLQAFEKAAQNDEELKKLGYSDKLTACAGVAIVKSRYPFARAYALSEELCSAAKQFRRSAGFKGGALDWYFTAGGLYSDLEEMRKREYTVSQGSLTLRPVALGDEATVGVHRWSVVEKLTSAFQNDVWAKKRNKAKLLRDALRQGPQEVERFRNVYIEKKGSAEDLPQLDGFANGWCEGVCGYFDALELMDIHIPLRTDQKAGE
ncbi:MAG: hypothetical protein DYG88_04735 [Chloroflexi bacterium CFX4]|nr:hypothetical protein [Chloroflexi bacterium CFX4]MDL1924118.1 hypothetical protein [Chloroflexi bacterium CFX3]